MAKQGFQQQLQRRDQLLGLLRSQDYWQTAQLCQQLMVSQRTLMRDIALLRDEGYPIESDRGRGGGVRLQGRWGLQRLHLNHREVIEMITALAVMENLQAPLFSTNLRQIRQKVARLFPDKQRHLIAEIRRRILIGDVASNEVISSYQKPAKGVSEKLLESFFEHQQIEVDYCDEKNHMTRRCIEPHYILLNWPAWYILSWDTLRGDTRLFRLDRIKRCKLLNSSFQLKKQNDFLRLYSHFFQSV